MRSYILKPFFEYASCFSGHQASKGELIPNERPNNIFRRYYINVLFPIIPRN